MNKIITRDTTKILQGINTVADIIDSTLGPKGRNVLISKSYSKPIVTNDGFQIATHCDFEDPLENTGARLLLEPISKTEENVKDGRSTTACLTREFIQESLNRISEGKAVWANQDPMELSRKITKNGKEIIELLDKQARKLKKSEIKDVALASVEDEESATAITKAFNKCGADGFITVEETNTQGVSVDLTQGISHEKVLIAANWMYNNSKEKKSQIKNVPIIVTNEKLEDTQAIPVLAEIMKTNEWKGMVIVAQRFTDEILKEFYEAKQMGYEIVAIKGGPLDDEKLQELAEFCQCDFVNEKIDYHLKDIKSKAVGMIGKVVTNEEGTAFTDGKGELKNTIATIKVGASTDTEINYKKAKIEDSINSTRVAIKEGVVAGGGVALKNVSEQLSEDNFLKEAILKPYTRIQKNAGGELEIPESVLDPVKVTKNAVNNAVSIASSFITTEWFIVEAPENAAQKLIKVLTDVE